MKDWIYNEFNQVGVDYSKSDTANEYDREMESFRDYQQEVEAFIEKLDISNPDELTIVDIGCGTGAFSIHAAKYFKEIQAVDVSEEMIKVASTKADAKGIRNIVFHNSGFLQFQPKAQVDIINTKWAFYHLPDYWKQAGLLNMNKMLKLNGILFMSDVVFQFDLEYESNTDKLISRLSNDFSEEFVDEVKIHIRDEYSTFDWVLQGLIERAGFSIQHVSTDDVLESEYLCRKIRSF